MIELFEHNQKAYDAVVSMLSETSKAAVIHPTGSGKSLNFVKIIPTKLYVGFRLRTIYSRHSSRILQRFHPVISPKT